MLFKFLSLVVTGMVGFGAHNVGVSQERMAIAQPMSVVAQAVPAEADVTLIPSASAPSFGRTKHEKQGSICINSRTRDHYVGELVSREEVRHYASKYWSGWDLDVAVALTVPEGQRDLNCVGDEGPEFYGKPTADGRHWGESIGLYQYRTIIEQKGKGGCDDIDWQVGNIERQTGCAHQKFMAKFPSGRQRKWTPWSAYTTKGSRNYRNFMNQ